MAASHRFVSSDALALGVASRLAARVGASPAVVRVAVCLLALAGGVGLLGYLLGAALLAGRTEPPPQPIRLRHNMGVIVAFCGVLLVVESFISSVPTFLLWPTAFVAFAATLAHPRLDGASSDWRGSIGRMVAGVALMVAGFLAAVASVGDLGSLWQVGTAVVILVAGIGFLLAPLLQGLLDSADSDRRERIRAEERSDIAAHLHDSVLQTLTLIQNRANDPQITAALAHQQERELRKWLYAGGGAPAEALSLRRALEQAAEEIEDQYLKFIECIVVGDVELTSQVEAAVGAAREAMINAAKFAATPMISVYAEATESTLVVFVRDRGIGFDLATVPEDRRGLSDSIRRRVDRCGGTAVIRTAPGAGTEVRIDIVLAGSPKADGRS